jgi:hypothetical protein
MDTKKEIAIKLFKELLKRLTLPYEKTNTGIINTENGAGQSAEEELSD